MHTSIADPAEPLIAIARSTVRDLHQGHPDGRITLDSTLDRDLGLDSLARVEFFARIQHELNARLPDSVFETAETLRDIAVAMRSDATISAVRQMRDEPEPSYSLAAAPPADIQTLDQVLSWHVRQHAEFPSITICGEGDDEIVTYGMLWREARAIAAGLQQHGLQLGEAVALMLPTSRNYFCTFFGVLLAGGVPVPLYPPARRSQVVDHVRRHAGILANSQVAILITTPQMRPLAGLRPR